MTLDDWLGAHPYLQPVGRFCAQVDAAAAGIGTVCSIVPHWDAYAVDFRAGVPLLKSADAGIDLESGGRTVLELVARLASDSLTGKPSADASALDAELRRDGVSAGRIAEWLLGDDGFTPSCPGLLRYLGWTAMATYLAPVVAAYGSWRDEEKWLRRYCPTCGSTPAMAQLVGTDPGRMRFLSCGCCGTRWQCSRTGCPFCGEDTRRLAVLAIEGEGGLRIDYCESCRGYLKTYDGQGGEAVLLADWTSLHLDVLAHDRGLKRLAASLYALSSLEPTIEDAGPGL